jgi:hypothetical protein
VGAAGLPAKTTPGGLGYSIDRQKEEKDDGRVNRNANTKNACLIVEQQTIVSLVSNSYVGSNLRDLFTSIVSSDQKLNTHTHTRNNWQHTVKDTGREKKKQEITRWKFLKREYREIAQRSVCTPTHTHTKYMYNILPQILYETFSFVGNTLHKR